MRALSSRLVELIERRADELTRRWLRDVRSHDATPTYRGCPESKLYHCAFNVYSHLGEWISADKSKAEIAEHFKALGARRRHDGFALSEVLQSFVIMRRHVWLVVREEGLLDTALSLYQAMDLTNRVILFYDRAMYNVALGYERAAEVRAA